VRCGHLIVAGIILSRPRTPDAAPSRANFLPTEVLLSDACLAMVNDKENCRYVTDDAFGVWDFVSAKRSAVANVGRPPVRFRRVVRFLDVRRVTQRVGNDLSQGQWPHARTAKRFASSRLKRIHTNRRLRPAGVEHPLKNHGKTRHYRSRRRKFRRNFGRNPQF
jgi:hypothetical protein